jgi:hypothetical protein
MVGDGVPLLAVVGVVVGLAVGRVDEDGEGSAGRVTLGSGERETSGGGESVTVGRGDKESEGSGTGETVTFGSGDSGTVGTGTGGSDTVGVARVGSEVEGSGSDGTGSGTCTGWLSATAGPAETASTALSPQEATSTARRLRASISPSFATAIRGVAGFTSDIDGWSSRT